MSSLIFESLPRPYPRWLGPFSPARGTRSGFRFHQGRLGTWVTQKSVREFWPVSDGTGVRQLTKVVREAWGGGRVLFLPNGFVVKPLQSDDEVGRRALIGRFRGSITLERPGGTMFDLGNPGTIRPGQVWPGPNTTGLECAIKLDGSLECTWYHPAPYGRELVSNFLRAPDKSLASGFRAARPGQSGGRVRITANGHVITNRKIGYDEWVSVYVGWVEPRSFGKWDDWIKKE